MSASFSEMVTLHEKAYSVPTSITASPKGVGGLATPRSRIVLLTP